MILKANAHPSPLPKYLEGFLGCRFDPAAGMKDILWMLYRKAPSTLVSKDIHGVGPAEYAIEYNLELKLVLTL